MTGVDGCGKWITNRHMSRHWKERCPENQFRKYAGRMKAGRPFAENTIARNERVTCKKCSVSLTHGAMVKHRKSSCKQNLGLLCGDPDCPKFESLVTPHHYKLHDQAEVKKEYDRALEENASLRAKAEICG